MPKRKLDEEFNQKYIIYGRTNTWVAALEKLIRKYKPVHADYAAKSPPPVAHMCSSHLLTPTSWWSSQKRVPHSRSHNKESRVSQSTKVFIHQIRCNFIIPYTQINQACYDFSGNRHDSTHPDTYNHGRIQRMLALVVDTSAHPRVAHPWAMCYKCYNESISLTTRLALNEFQASY